jgi:uncharacterized protein (DUF2267 family)
MEFATRDVALRSETVKEGISCIAAWKPTIGKDLRMNEQGLETIETTTQKTHEWIARIAESMHMEKRDPWKSLRPVLQKLRDRLPVVLAVHFGAQLPMLVRGLYYEGWEPSKVPIKMSLEDFLAVVQSRIIADRVIDPIETVQNVLAIIANHIGGSEMQKVMDAFPRDTQSLCPALASAA